MQILSLAHVSLVVSDLARARQFYEGVLGLSPCDNRPELGFDGIWYDLGAQQIHLLALPNPDPVTGRPEHGGRDRHVAFWVKDLEGVRETLEHFGIRFTMSRSGRRALFLRDPDGNAVEMTEE